MCDRGVATYRSRYRRDAMRCPASILCHCASAVRTGNSYLSERVRRHGLKPLRQWYRDYGPPLRVHAGAAASSTVAVRVSSVRATPSSAALTHAAYAPLPQPAGDTRRVPIREDRLAQHRRLHGGCGASRGAAADGGGAGRDPEEHPAARQGGVQVQGADHAHIYNKITICVVSYHVNILIVRE